MAQNWREVELAAVEHFEVSSAVHPSLSAACDVQSSHGLSQVPYALNASVPLAVATVMALAYGERGVWLGSQDVTGVVEGGGGLSRESVESVGGGCGQRSAQ